MSTYLQLKKVTTPQSSRRYLVRLPGITRWMVGEWDGLRGCWIEARLDDIMSGNPVEFYELPE